MFKNVRSGLLVATAVVVALAPAQVQAKCNIFKPSTCNPIPAIQNVVQDVNNAVNNTTNAAANAVGYAGFAAAQAAGYADTVAMNAAHGMATANTWANLAEADAASKAMGFKNYAERIARDSEVVGRDQYEGLRNDALRNYTNGSNQAKNLYETARSTVAPYQNRAYTIAEFYRNVCFPQATGNLGKITPYVNKVNTLHDNGKREIYRVLRTLARGSTPDRQTLRDMKYIGINLGLVAANGVALVGNAYQSNWGISLGAAGGWVGGVNSSVSFSMDTYPTNGQYKMAIAVNTGVQVAAGTGTLAPGASIGFGLGWGPGSSVDASGVTMTAGGALGGVDVSAQWTTVPVLAEAIVNDARRGTFDQQTLTNGLTQQVRANIETVCQSPGLSVGVGTSTPGNAGDLTFSPGYTHVVWTGSVNQ